MEVIQLVQQQTTMVMVLELAVAVEVAAATAAAAAAAAAVAAAATAMPIHRRVAAVRLGLPKRRATRRMMMTMALVPKVPHQIPVTHHEKMTRVIRVAEVMATKNRMRGWFAIVTHQQLIFLQIISKKKSIYKKFKHKKQTEKQVWRSQCTWPICAADLCYVKLHENCNNSETNQINTSAFVEAMQIEMLSSSQPSFGSPNRCRRPNKQQQLPTNCVQMHERPIRLHTNSHTYTHKCLAHLAISTHKNDNNQSDCSAILIVNLLFPTANPRLRHQNHPKMIKVILSFTNQSKKKKNKKPKPNIQSH